MAVSRYRLLPAETYKIPDSINLMAYDFYGRHSTWEGTLEALEFMLTRYEIPPEKIVMGSPSTAGYLTDSHRNTGIKVRATGKLSGISRQPPGRMKQGIFILTDPKQSPGKCSWLQIIISKVFLSGRLARIWRENRLSAGLYWIITADFLYLTGEWRQK